MLKPTTYSVNDISVKNTCKIAFEFANAEMLKKISKYLEFRMMSMIFRMIFRMMVSYHCCR